MRSRSHVLLIAGVVASMYGVGCGPSTSGPKWPDPVEVGGKVTFQGKPFANGTVIFIPEGQTVGKGGSGLTNEAGEYQADSIWSGKETRKGLIPGKYRVAFSRYIKPDGSVWIAEPDSAEGPASVGAREELPLELSNPAESKFEIEVSAGKPKHDFDLP